MRLRRKRVPALDSSGEAPTTAMERGKKMLWNSFSLFCSKKITWIKGYFRVRADRLAP
jgi:hypothetical protein